MRAWSKNASTVGWPAARIRTPLVSLIAVATLAAAPALTACGGPTRSVAAFCSTYRDEKAQFLKRYASTGQPIASNDPQALSKSLKEIMMGLQSLGDGTIILTKLDKVAPEDIEPDMAAVVESWKSMQKTMGDEAGHITNPGGLLGDIVKGTIAAVEANGPWTRVSDYTSQHCT